MTPGALLGLGVLNLLYLAVGIVVLWAARGIPSWTQALQLSGFGYLCGVALVGSLLTVELMLGIPLSVGSILATSGIACAVAVMSGRRLRRETPRVRPVEAAPLVSVAGAIALAAAGVFLEALFRAGRLSGLFAWDAWAFWVPKGKAIYYLGGLDEGFFGSLPGPSYPPLLPTLDAAAFHFMGTPDVVTLHLQFWCFAAGFALAAAGLLSERVPPWLFWPFVLLALLAPRANERLLTPQADFLLDYFLVVAALLVLNWMKDGAAWQLGLATLLLTACVLTKREGLLLAACLFAAAALATLRRGRRFLPALALAAAVVALAAAAWRLWLALAFDASNLSTSEGLDLGLKAERLWPSLRLAIEVLFDLELWTVLGPLFVAAILIAAAARAGTAAVFAGSTLVLMTLGGAWITWAIPELPITAAERVNPIVRYMAAPVLLGAVLSPALLAEAWRPSGGSAFRRRSGDVRVPRSLAIVAVGGVLLAYPISVLAGGMPRFPSAADCRRPAVPDAPVDLVFGSFDRQQPADALANRVLRFGFVQARVLADGCGHWEVAVTGYETLDAARGAQVEAQGVGLPARLERPAP